jgi:serine/threonine-protein kinase
VPEGHVVSQSVTAGTEVRPDTKVDLVVSQGPAPVAIPDVRGRSYEEAAAALSGVGLTPTKREEFNNEFEAGRVVGTEPAIGTEVPPNSDVVVIVSRGPDLVRVPRVLGLSFDEASQVLIDAGFEVDLDGRYRPGQNVSSQDPAPGSRIPRGSSVSIRLGNDD